MLEWKAIGPVPKSESDRVWQRFRTAMLALRGTRPTEVRIVVIHPHNPKIVFACICLGGLLVAAAAASAACGHPWK
jgi:hypothetical protein